MIANRTATWLSALGVSFGVLACTDPASPKRPGTAITYIRTNPRSLVVSSPDGKQMYATYPLPFVPDHAELSPDHSQIVMSNEGLGELWVESTADGQARMIVGRDSGAATPSWSADGKHILFYRSTDGGAWMIDPDGSNGHPVAISAPAFAPQIDPVWSPDESQIAFDSPYAGVGPGGYRLFVMNADGTNAHLVSIPAVNTLGDAWQPAWSRDGRQLAFVRSVDTTTAIWIANADGSAARCLISRQESSPTSASEPAFRRSTRIGCAGRKRDAGSGTPDILVSCLEVDKPLGFTGARLRAARPAGRRSPDQIPIRQP